MNIRTRIMVSKFLLLCFSTAAHMCTGLVSPALPKIIAEYQSTPHIGLLARLLITMPHFFIAVCSPIVGILIIKLNRRLMLMIAPIIYALVGIICFMTDNIYVMIVARAFLGIAVAMIVPTVTSIIADSFSDATRKTMIGLQTTFMSIGSITFSLMSGILSDINWHYVFLAYLIPSILTPLAYLFIRPQHNTALMRQKSTVDPDDAIKGYAITFAVYLIAALHMMIYYFIPLQLPIILESLGRNSKDMGYCMALETLVTALVAAYYRKIKQNRDYATVCLASFVIMAVAFLLIGTANSYTIIISACAIYGIGMGMMMPNNTSWIIYAVNTKYRNLAIGGFSTAVYIGKFSSAIFVYYSTKILNSGQACYIFGAMCMLIIALTIFGISNIKSNSKNKILSQ